MSTDMCGRFALATRISDVAKRFRVQRIDPTLPGPCYNIAPSADIVIEHRRRAAVDHREMWLCPLVDKICE